VYEMNPRTMAPRYLRSGQVLLDDGGMPFAVVSSKPNIAPNGTVTVQTRVYPDGPFDVRMFSGRHEHRPTHGHAGIESWPTFAAASARCDRLNRARTHEDVRTWREYAALYRHDSAAPAYLSALESFMPVEFPPGADVTVAWMGPHPPALGRSAVTRTERYRLRSVPGGYRGDYVYRYVRRYNGSAFEFTRIVWGDGSVSVSAHRAGTTEIVHEWVSGGVLAPAAEPAHTCGPGMNYGCDVPECDGNVGD